MKRKRHRWVSRREKRRAIRGHWTPRMLGKRRIWFFWSAAESPHEFKNLIG